MKDEIVFIYPTIGQEKTINHGIAAISSVLKNNGFETSLICLENFDFHGILKKIKEIEPLYVTASVTYNHWKPVNMFAEYLKKNADICFFAGGPHTILFPESFDDAEYIDGICTGEGEEANLELAVKMRNGENFYDTEGFWFRKDGRVIRNKRRRLIEDLDKYPFPDYEIFPYEAVMNYPAFIFSRGCPFDCSYCCNHRYREIFRGSKLIRFKSVERAIGEIKAFLERYSPDVINFDDDTFIKNPKWRCEFLGKYAKEIAVPFNCNARADLITDRVCEELKGAGCNMVGIGLESGDYHLRKKMLSRDMSNKVILSACAKLKKHGIKVSTFNIVGIPGENAIRHEKTVLLNKKIMPEECQVSVYFPYPGTELGDYCRKNGLVDENKEAFNFIEESVLHLKDFPQKDIEYAARVFMFKVFYPSDVKKAVSSVRNRKTLDAVRKFLGRKLPRNIYLIWCDILESREKFAGSIKKLNGRDMNNEIFSALLENAFSKAGVFVLKEAYKSASVLKRSGIDSGIVFEKIVEAVERDYIPFLSGAYFHMGEIMYGKGEYTEAVRFFENLIKFNIGHKKGNELLNECEKRKK